MKINTLLSYLFENVDEAALRGFSLDILKKETERLKAEKGYTGYTEDISYGLYNLAEKYDLPYMGEGSARVVYALSTGKVLKISRNRAGRAQNKAELEVSRDPSLKYIGARVYETDPDFYWSVIEVAKIYQDSEQLKLDLGIPPFLAQRYSYYITTALDDIRSITDDRSTIDEVIENRHYSFDDEEKQEQYRKFLEDPPKSLLALVDLSDRALGSNSLEYGDIITNHFGKTASGRPVLIDYGFTTGVRYEHYTTLYTADLGTEAGGEIPPASGMNIIQHYTEARNNSVGSPPPSSIMDRDEEEDWGPLGPPSNRDEGDALDRERMLQMRRRRGVSGEQV